MFVYTHGGGRLGNQLLRAAHFQAWLTGSGAGNRIANFSFTPFAARLLAAPVALVLQSKSGISVCSTLKIDANSERFKKFHFGVRRYHEKRLPGSGIWYDFDACEFAERTPYLLGDSWAPIRLVCGWKFSCLADLTEHHDMIQRQFRKMLGDLPGLGQAGRIGIHIRRGDYRVWLGGRFFHDFDTYSLWIAQIMESHGRGYSYHVVSDANCRANLKIPEGYTCVFSPEHSTESEDFLRLASCGLIYGPPSTFSTMAAFIGGSRLCVLDGAGDIAKLAIMSCPLLEMHTHPAGKLAVN